MGFLDTFKSESIATLASNATSSAAKLENFFSNPTSLITQGVAAAGNLTPEQIAAGLRGSPPQPSVVPSTVPADAISNASAIPGAGKVAGVSMGLLALLGIGGYFLLKRK